MAFVSVVMKQPWNDALTLQISNDLGLSEAVQKIARKELREDKKAREIYIQQFREWIKQNQDIENVRCDDRFLLRFLRQKKFSILMAQQTLLKYLNLKKHFETMTTNLDFLSPQMNELITNGYMFVSPVKDKHGRRVIIGNAKNFDPHKNCSADMAKAHVLTYEALLEDPETQVLGVTHVGDLKGITAAHITCWNPNEFARIVKWGEQSLPLRHKEIHLTNVPTTVKWVLDFAKSRVSSKMRDRFQVYTDIAQLHKKVDPICLPKELGGSMPMAEMIELWKRELVGKRDLLLALDKMKILNDRGIIRSDRNNNNNNNGLLATDSIEGSFRKLEVD